MSATNHGWVYASAASQRKAAQDAADFIADVELLVSAGESTEAIAARLGVKPDSIKSRLYRHQRHDLVHRLAANDERWAWAA